jgi:hypothetical protein
MSEHEKMLSRLGEILSQIARPYRVEQALPVDVRTSLWQLGFPCSEQTPREELIERLWARKRTLQLMMPPPQLGGPGATPPAAA